MDRHVKHCDKKYCRAVYWGNETEYKYIGYEDQTSEVRKKTDCTEAKALNTQMKNIVHRIRIEGI
jgi:hypothetical protein